MNKGVYSCLKCDFEAPDYQVIPYTKGFADSSVGLMVVWECPVCFSDWFFHARENEDSPYNYVTLLEEYRKDPVNYIDRAYDRYLKSKN